MSDTSNTPRESEEREESRGFSRRGFLKGAGISAVAVVVADKGVVQAQQGEAPVDASAMNKPMAGEVKITLNINNQERPVTVEPRTTLLSAMRDRLEPPLTGPKLVCNAGTCGACTVIMNGKIAYGCSLLAVDTIGKKITTVEGIGTPEKLSPVQAAFVEKDAMMCGFCTDGFVTSITAFLEAHPTPTLAELKEGIKGNFCRCGTYPHVFEAAMAASKVAKASLR